MIRLFRLLATFYLAAQIVGMAGPARADDGPTSPPGSSICRALAHLLDGAWSSAVRESKFAIDTTEKALQFMVLANAGGFAVIEPNGGLAFMPAELDRVRAAAATLGYEFSPARWEADPDETVRLYSEYLDDDYIPDFAIERRKSGASCSVFEFWRSDEATGLLSPMPSPEGWESCGIVESSNQQIRFLANLYGQATIPVLAEGRGLEADFYLYNLTRPLQSASKPRRGGALAKRDLDPFRVPALCRVRLERQVDFASEGAEFCSRFGELVRSAVFDRSYAIGEPLEGLLTLVRSRSPNVELTWQAVVIGGTAGDLQSALAELGLGPEEADRLTARFAYGAPTLWVSSRRAETDSVIALIQGVASSGHVQTLVIQGATGGVRVGELPLIWLTSDSSREQSWPFVYEERAFLLQTYLRSPQNLELALRPLGAPEQRDGDCRLTLNDKDMQAAIEYEPKNRP